METALLKEGHQRPEGKAVHLDQRLLQTTREIARRAADHNLVKKEESLRPFWDGWEEEIKILRSKLNPLLDLLSEPSYFH